MVECRLCVLVTGSNVLSPEALTGGYRGEIVFGGAGGVGAVRDLPLVVAVTYLKKVKLVLKLRIT